MILPEDMKTHLEQLAATPRNCVFYNLRRGSVVPKSWGLSYEIDNPDIDKMLGDFPEGAIPYGPIHRKLSGRMSKIRELFGGARRIPFSRAYMSGLGECLEKAVLVQLSTQRRSASFIISGLLTQDTETGSDSHAFNIVFVEGKPFLVDAALVLAEDAQGNITRPYTAPVLGIEGEYGEFRVPEEWRQGRTYSIS